MQKVSTKISDRLAMAQSQIDSAANTLRQLTEGAIEAYIETEDNKLYTNLLNQVEALDEAYKAIEDFMREYR